DGVAAVEIDDRTVQEEVCDELGPDELSQLHAGEEQRHSRHRRIGIGVLRDDDVLEVDGKPERVEIERADADGVPTQALVHLVLDPSPQRLVDEEGGDDGERDQRPDDTPGPDPPSAHGAAPPRLGARALPVGPGSADLCAENRAIGVEQDHLASFVVRTEDENLGHEWPDLLGWKIHDGNDEASDKLLRTIVPGDLGAGAFDTKLTEVDPQPVGRATGLWKLTNVGHHADAHIDLLEVLPRDRNARLPAVEEAQRRPRVVELENSPRGVALLGHALGAPLTEADAVAVAATGEVRRLAIDGDREQRALQSLEADHASEIVASDPDSAARASNGHHRRPQRWCTLRHLDRADEADVHAALSQHVGQLTEADVEAPVGVRRAGRERAHDRLERRNVAGGEDRARVFRIAPALAVVE